VAQRTLKDVFEQNARGSKAFRAGAAARMSVRAPHSRGHPRPWTARKSLAAGRQIPLREQALADAGVQAMPKSFRLKSSMSKRCD